MDAPSPGILIVVEGIDGAGKTTQLKRLCDGLSGAGETIVASKEPTDGFWGRQLRESAQSGRMTLDDELAMFVRDRQEHVENVVRPALDAGSIVLIDRYFYSTIAYQGSRGADVAALESQMRREFPTPDVVLLIDVPPEVGLERIERQRGEMPNHFERADALTHVRQIFLDLKDRDPAIHLINGSRSRDEVFADVAHTVLDTALKSKRCAKSYDCDIFYCSFRINGECQWWNLRGKLNGAEK